MQTTNKIALVTGANRGLGFEIARQLGHKGITVLLGARNEALGASAAEQLSRDGIMAFFIPLDITRPESIANAVKTIEDRYGRLDILVNNAARLPVTPADQHNPSDISQELLAEYMNINFLAQVAVTQAFLPLLRLRCEARGVAGLPEGRWADGVFLYPLGWSPNGQPMVTGRDLAFLE